MKKCINLANSTFNIYVLYIKLGQNTKQFRRLVQENFITVKPAVAATSIKRDPPLSGHFRAARTILNANAPLLSVHLSNAASGRRNSPQNTEIVSSNGQFLFFFDAASFD